MEAQDPRKIVRDYLVGGDLRSLLIHAAGFHGHYCRGLAYGLVAGYAGVNRFGFENTGMEEFLAVVECNNCFADGIQVATGCTFGNNALIYHDLGKMAVTFISRKSEKAYRLVLKSGRHGSQPASPKEQEAKQLFQRVVGERKDDPQSARRMRELFRELSLETVEKPAQDLFEIQEAPAALPSYAPSYDSVACAQCGEEFMETRGVIRQGKPVCLSCAGVDTHAVLGRGISFLKKGKLR